LAFGGLEFGIFRAVTSPDPSFFAVIEYLYSLKPRGAKFGIDRMRAFVAELGPVARTTPCVHIAGTNGKGSVAAMLESILRTAGWRTGLYTSPHLLHVGERVQVNRTPLTDAEIVSFLRELRPVAERIGATDPELSPSFFEYMTAMALLQFARQRCDIAVIEVGLGGRLDATNVVAPEACVITSIGYDHCELLGHTLTQIAGEKAGIIKAGVPVIVGHMPREAEKVIRATAAQIGAPVVSVAERFGDAVEALPRTSLEGEYQRWNAATATLTALALGERWKISAEVVSRGLASVQWPGRWERRQMQGRLVILDASHNPEGAAALDANLRALVRETGIAPIVIVGVLGSARARPLLETIARHAASIHLVVPDDPRACGYAELEALIPSGFRGRVVRDSVARLFPSPDRCDVADTAAPVVVTGSIYLLGEVLGQLEAGSIK
jgi:dihydrofolate synthase/folylpolyglutamate synthase